jgi:hypothetical protein
MPLALLAIGCICPHYTLFIKQIILIADIFNTGADPKTYEHLRQRLPICLDIALWIIVHMDDQSNARLIPSLA